MPDFPQPTEWFSSRFGDHSIEVMKALVAAGRAAHERSRDAKDGSKLKSNDAYGSSFWLCLPEELVNTLSFLPAAEILRPKRSRYDLLVFNGAVMFPAKCANDSGGPDKLKLRTSRLRTQLFSLESRFVHEVLDFGDFDFDAAKDTPPLVPDFGSATALVLIAYDCSARGGLQSIYIGEAKLLEDGTVNWLYREELPLRTLTEGPSALTLVDSAAPRFDNAPIPEAALELRLPGENLNEEELVNPATAQTASTGTGDDERG